MCGIAAIFHLTTPGSPIDAKLVERMRDRLTHRGPDDAGIWSNEQACIAHRRLIVIDPTPAGHQPMISSDGRFVLAYNGELYNDHDLRIELGSLGVVFQTSCDTETLLHALITWGEDAISKLRGMYTFTFLDTESNKLLIARDPLGIKPLYYAMLNTGHGQQLAVASEIPALLEHPGISRTPDPVTFSAYLSSIRTTLGSRTMFSSISTLEPGESISVDLNDPTRSTSQSWWDNCSRGPTQGIRATIEESVHRHLRTDVPICALLSGGLDSAITATLAMRSRGELHTYCAGARTEGFNDDFIFARQVAQSLGTTHHEIEVTQQRFVEQLPNLVNLLGNPMSTPNEVAIHEVALALRSKGHIVTISGEGADELFGGYVPIMQQCAAHTASLRDRTSYPDGGLMHLRANAWISDELKPAVLNPVRLAEADNDEHLRAYYNATFQRLHERSPTDSPLQAHLQFQRRLNLPNLLQRLDTATMLAGVEGRTPFADIEVAIAAESLPMSRKFVDDEREPQTKIALREAFGPDLAAEVIQRPKASFPLPFQQWLGPFGDLVFESPFARQYFSAEAIGLVSANPNKYWHMAWPMINLTIWGQAWVMNDPVDSDRFGAALSSC